MVMVGLSCKHNIEHRSFYFLYNVGLYPKLSNHLASQNEASCCELAEKECTTKPAMLFERWKSSIDFYFALNNRS